MTPEEFTKEMQRLKDEEAGDLEGRHGSMDALMVKVLSELGYGDGVEIFGNTEMWYA